MPVSAYVGYYADQRSGDAIHSPRTACPDRDGNRWRQGPCRSTRPTGRSPSPATRSPRELDRQLVLYWYQGRGRIVSGEYANKAWLMLDAARSGRSDGGLVRLIGPVVTSPDETLRELSSFAAQLLPHLSRYLP